MIGYLFWGGVCRSVEDMMKRSFSEFRTQRELGAKNLPKVMEKCMNALTNIEVRGGGRGDRTTSMIHTML